MGLRIQYQWRLRSEAVKILVDTFFQLREHMRATLILYELRLYSKPKYCGNFVEQMSLLKVEVTERPR